LSSCVLFHQDLQSSADEEEELDVAPEVAGDRAKPKGNKRGQTNDMHLDDVSSPHYNERALEWAQQHYRHRIAQQRQEEDQGGDNDEMDVDNLDWRVEETTPSPDDVAFEGGFRLPSSSYAALFDYQRTGVRWLWELHCQNAGGYSLIFFISLSYTENYGRIIGDEMGLGKTIQAITFLGGLRYSGLNAAPSLIVCPATLLRQWRREFHRWWPPACIGILHSASMSSSSSSSQTLKAVDRQNGVLITTYESLKLFRSKLLSVHWSYVFLDEGHKIRNPDAAITLAVKQLKVTSNACKSRFCHLFVFVFLFSDEPPDHPLGLADPEQADRAVVPL